MTTVDQIEAGTRLKVTVVSDFICPWCYIGLEEIERLFADWDIELGWAPFFLDPSIPPEGRDRAPVAPDAPPTPVETRGASLGLDFRRGRTFTPHTLLALQAGAFAQHHGTTEQVFQYHRALFKAYFTDFENLMDIDVLVKHAEGCGLDGAAMREALTNGTFEDEVNTGIEESYAVGVTGIPTFILNDKYAVVGAQPRDVLERVFTQLGAQRRR
jgi:predicted DsbA family dithiol-disulfide isomerase